MCPRSTAAGCFCTDSWRAISRAPIARTSPAGWRPARAPTACVAARLARDVRPQVSAAGWQVYDTYLKANHVEAGAESYEQVVRLVLGTALGRQASAN